MHGELANITSMMDELVHTARHLAIVVSRPAADQAPALHTHPAASKGTSILSFLSVAIWVIALGLMVWSKISRGRAATDATSTKPHRKTKAHSGNHSGHLKVARGHRDGV